MTEPGRTGRVEGYLNGGNHTEEGETHWGVDFYTVTHANAGADVPIREQALVEAGVSLVRDAVVVADINVDAATAAEILPHNLEAGGVLPALTEVLIFSREDEEA